MAATTRSDHIARIQGFLDAFSALTSHADQTITHEFDELQTQPTLQLALLRRFLLDGEEATQSDAASAFALTPIPLPEWKASIGSLARKWFFAAQTWGNAPQPLGTALATLLADDSPDHWYIDSVVDHFLKPLDALFSDGLCAIHRVEMRQLGATLIQDFETRPGHTRLSLCWDAYTFEADDRRFILSWELDD